MKTEIIPVIEPSNLRIVGAVERKFAHEFGIPHPTVLLLAFQASNKAVAVYVRSVNQSSPGSTDTFGGHCALSADQWPKMLAGELGVASIIRNTTIREANEELHLTNSDGSAIIINEANADHFLRQVGELGQFGVESPKNFERSTLFLVKIADGISVHPHEEVDGKEFEVELEWIPLDALITSYQQQRRPFADGAARILERTVEDVQFRRTLENSIRSFAETN